MKNFFNKHETSLWCIGAVLAILIPALLWGSKANAASDSPTPYSVTKDGITLPAGYTFPDNGHVNLQTVGFHKDMHFESKCITRTDAECAGDLHNFAQFIGKSFIPWSAFGITGTTCVKWVQLGGWEDGSFEEHYGEGGQPPIGPNCKTTPEPTPTVTTPPPPQPETQYRTYDTPVSCPIRAVWVVREKRTRTYQWDNGWVAGPWSPWSQVSTEIRDATPQELLAQCFEDNPTPTPTVPHPTVPTTPAPTVPVPTKSAPKPVPTVKVTPKIGEPLAPVYQRKSDTTLPDTGGTHARWAVLGIVLIVCGSAFIVTSRRRVTDED